MTWIETTDGEWINSERIIGFAIQNQEYPATPPGFRVVAHSDEENFWTMRCDFETYAEARVWLRQYMVERFQ